MGGAPEHRDNSGSFACASRVNNVFHTLDNVFGGDVLPESKNRPAVLPERPVRLSVPLTGASNLPEPVVGVALEVGAAMLWAAMPEAAVQKDRDLLAREDNVGSSTTAGQRHRGDAVAIAVLMEGPSDCQLGLVVTRTVRLHVAAPRRGCCPRLFGHGLQPTPPAVRVKSCTAQGLPTYCDPMVDVTNDPNEQGVLDQSVDDDEELIQTEESTLSHFGADFDIAGLVRRLEDRDIIIPRFDPDESDGATIAGFQRQGVWAAPRMEKFIESLLLGWPVPSIFLVLDTDQRYLVLDGQQRLTTLQSFFSGYFPNGREFKLHDVAEHLKGVTYKTLGQESRRKLHNTFIQATVIEPIGDEGRDSVYKLFGRLNSGGVSLTAQEIRVALYRGPVVEWIRDLNHDLNWRRLFGPAHSRLKDHELVLRSVALSLTSGALQGNWETKAVQQSAYTPPMSEFLNNFLKAYKAPGSLPMDELGKAFAESCRLIVEAGGSNSLKFQGVLNAAHVDAVLATLTSLGQSGRAPNVGSVRSGLHELRGNADYNEYVTRSTSHRENVVGRLRLAYQAFTE